MNDKIMAMRIKQFFAEIGEYRDSLKDTLNKEGEKATQFVTGFDVGAMAAASCIYKVIGDFCGNCKEAENGEIHNGTEDRKQ